MNKSIATKILNFFPENAKKSDYMFIKKLEIFLKIGNFWKHFLCDGMAVFCVLENYSRIPCAWM